MQKYGPEILMGLVLSLSLCLVVRSGGTLPPPVSSPVPQIEPERAAVKAAVKLASVAADEAAFDEGYSLKLLRDGAVEEISLRDYLVGVLLTEVPMSFDMEALKAQAIASRTYALHCQKHEEANVCADSGCCQAWRDAAAQAERFEDQYAAYEEKARRAVESTDGEVITYHGALIDATFFACSGGRTEDAAAVWGSEVPYLKAVDSPGEEAVDCFHSVCEISPAEFSEKLGVALPGDPAAWLGDTQVTTGGGVDAVEIGGTAYRGTQLRQCFGLKSAKFTVSYIDGTFLFDVYGYGHRVGMSQYGAQAMAQTGADAEEIIKAYYTGVEIETLSK